ncbi:MAG: hypothetical protein LLG08_00655 [Actinomycetia bacterium]|nr:hypothetical protein [Actinomycetes bacterium]
MPVKFGTGTFGVFAPVLLAAVLIMTAVPGCVMPSCIAARGSAVSACQAPQPQQFYAACQSDSQRVAMNVPCSGDTCDDSTMSHGAPDAIVAPGADVPVPAAATVVRTPVMPAVVLSGRTGTSVLFPDVHPPGPLGVRLLV